MSRRVSLPLARAAALAALAAPARAHDFWLAPSTFEARPEERIAVNTCVGHFPEGELLPRDPRRLLRFFAVADAEAIDLEGAPGALPAGAFVAKAPGVYALGYQSERSPLSLPADKFEAYLREEGLDAVLEERRTSGHQARPGLEVYSRCAKALVTVGAPTGPGCDRVLGLPLELLLEADPRGIQPGDALPVRLLYQGQPCPGVRVVLHAVGAPALAQRTDAGGRTSFRLPERTVWFLKAVHMVRAPAGVPAEWESFWASLVFASGKEETWLRDGTRVTSHE